jgi:integrase
MSNDLAHLPFAEAAMAWLQSRALFISPRTETDYANYIKMLTGFFRKRTLAEINADDIRAYQRMRMSRAGGSAINHECSVLQQLLKRIGRWPEIGAQYQPLPLPKESPHRALTPAEEERLYRVGARHPEWDVAYCAAVISINTTAGPGEIRHVRLKDVQMDHPEGPIFRVQPKKGATAERECDLHSLQNEACRTRHEIPARQSGQPGLYPTRRLRAAIPHEEGVV